MKTPIQTNQAPAAIGPYSQAIEAGGMVFVSGQLPIDPATGEFAAGDIQALTHQSLTNLKHVLEAAGLTLANVVKTTVFLADLADFAAMNEVYATYFSAPFPARSAVAVLEWKSSASLYVKSSPTLVIAHCVGLCTLSNHRPARKSPKRGQKMHKKGLFAQKTYIFLTNYL